MDAEKILSKIEQIAETNAEPGVFEANFQKNGNNYFARIRKSEPIVFDLIEVNPQNQTALVIAGKKPEFFCYKGIYIGREFPIDVVRVYEQVVLKSNRIKNGEMDKRICEILGM